VPLRPLDVRQKTLLHLGGDGGLRLAAVLLSVTASVKRHGLNPWLFLRYALSLLPARPAGTDLTDLLPEVWSRAPAERGAVAG
jgi:transposase